MSRKIVSEDTINLVLDEISQFVLRGLGDPKAILDASTFMRWNEACFQMCCAEREAEYIRRIFVPFIELAKQIQDKKKRHQESIEYVRQNRICPGIVKDMNNLIADQLEIASNFEVAIYMDEFYNKALHIQRACSYISRFFLPNRMQVQEAISIEISKNHKLRIEYTRRLDDMICQLLTF